MAKVARFGIGKTHFIAMVEETALSKLLGGTARFPTMRARLLWARVPIYWDTIPLQYCTVLYSVLCTSVLYCTSGRFASETARARHLPACPYRPPSQPRASLHYLRNFHCPRAPAPKTSPPSTSPPAWLSAFMDTHEFSCKLRQNVFTTVHGPIHLRGLTLAAWTGSDCVFVRLMSAFAHAPTTPDGLAAFLLIQFLAFSSETSSQPTFSLS